MGSGARDTILFLAGLLGVLHQTVISDMAQWPLLVTFSAMMGLPVVLRKDEGGK